MNVKASLTLIAAGLALATQASASEISWTSWSDFTQDSVNGAATGTAGSVGVSYSGELENLFYDYPSWTPASTYVGGDVGNAPPSAGGIIQLYGAQGATDTITFSQAVTNPVLAIWSLGAGGNAASFNFTDGETPVLQAGGPSAEYGGASITVDGNTVFGQEGNGTVEFLGTYSQISWTNPTYEDWFGFTVGYASGVPEPANWAMMLLGFGVVGAALRGRRGRSIAAA